MSDSGFQFHAELFDYRAQAMEALSAAEFEWFSHYNSVDLVHDEFGLEVCGIRVEAEAREMMRVLEHAFPGWHARRLHLRERTREPGWKFVISRSAPGSGPGRERVG